MIIMIIACMDVFPKEIFEKIFEYLDPISATCARIAIRDMRGMPVTVEEKMLRRIVKVINHHIRAGHSANRDMVSVVLHHEGGPPSCFGLEIDSVNEQEMRKRFREILKNIHGVKRKERHVEKLEMRLIRLPFRDIKSTEYFEYPDWDFATDDYQKSLKTMSSKIYPTE